MTEETTASQKVGKPSRKKLVAIIAAAVLVLGGGITAGIVGVNAYNTETEAICKTALDGRTAALKDAKTATEAADELLAVTAEPIALPEDAGTTKLYTERPAVEAVEAKPAGKDKDGKDTAEVKAVEARKSGQELVDDVTNAKDALGKLSVPEKCTDRDQAKVITDATAKVKTATTTLTKATEALTEDVEAFKVDETARIAAEKKAAEEAAAKKAEEERIAAEQAAAAEAERQRQADAARNSGGGGGYTGGGGECGYDESVEYATAVLTERPAWLRYENITLTREQQDTFQWIDPVGGHTGSLSNNGPITQGYAMSLIEKGLASVDGGSDAYLAAQEHAQEKNIGLWATCEGFGQ